MAGFGFSISDVVNAIKLAHRIYDTYFNRQNSADSQYAEFGAEIRTFRSLLERFGQSYSNAVQKYEDQPHVPLSNEPMLRNPKDDVLEQERKSVVGNFEQTLKECERFLARHTRRESSRLVIGISWITSARNYAAALRARLQFHTLKIQWLMELYSNGLQRDLTEQLTRVEETLGEIHEVVVHGVRPRVAPSTPEALTRRFNDALVINAPTNFRSGQKLPMEEGFDALIYHLSQSTIQSHGFLGSAQSLEQYINLHKAQWIWTSLQGSSNYDSSFYFKRLILKLGHQIRREFSRENLTVYEEHELDTAPASAFAIWKPANSERISADENTNEREFTLLELKLADTQQTLIVNRMGDAELHLIQSSQTRINDEVVREVHENTFINVHAHHFEPTYASPSLSEQVSRVVIFESAVRSGSAYDLESLSDVFQFQQAVTGFRVVSDITSVTWSYDKKKPVFGREVESNVARLQIWQHRPLTRQNHPSGPATSGSDSSVSGSRTSDASCMTTAQKIVSNFNPNIVSVDPGTQSITLRRPVMPLLVFYTQVDKRRDRGRMLLHVQLTPNVKINTRLCNCRRDRDSCLRVVLDSKPENKLLVLCLTEKKGQRWDLAVLGLPRHPQFRDRMVRLNCHYLALDFDSPAEKQKFIADHERISILRDTDIREYFDARKELQRRSNQPNQEEVRDGIPRRVSIAPALDEPDLGPSFPDAVAANFD